MKTVWKVLIPFVLVVPLGAYVAGSLVASASEEPAPRETIEINESSTEPSPKPESPRATLETPPPTSRGDDEPEVIVPEYEDLDDDDDEGDDDRDDDRDDDSGPGGGDD